MCWLLISFWIPRDRGDGGERRENRDGRKHKDRSSKHERPVVDLRAKLDKGRKMVDREMVRNLLVITEVHGREVILQIRNCVTCFWNIKCFYLHVETYNFFFLNLSANLFYFSF